MTAVTYTFSAGTTISPAEVNQNFADLVAAVDSVNTSNLRDDAGLKSTQLSDRYSLVPWSIVLVPFTDGNTYATPGAITMPAADTTIYETTFRVGSGKRASVAAVEVDVQAVASAPRITVIIGGTTLGGGSQTLVAGRNYVANTDPVANPQLALADLDTLQLQLGNGGTLRGVTVTIWIKEELVS